MKITITTLVENHVSKSDLLAEHGLSFMIEHPQGNILFDVGQSDVFAKNAKKMGFDISKVDQLVISHGHYDHLGGLPHFIENNNAAPIFLKNETLTPKFHNEKYIGVSKHINVKNPRFQFVSEPTEIAQNIYLMPKVENYFPLDLNRKNFFVEGHKQDVFNDEMFLVFDDGEELTVLSGCSHNGITNMLETATIYFNKPIVRVIGGFHLKNASFKTIEHVGNYFNEKNVSQINTCHCTGLTGFNQLSKHCTGQVNYNEVSSVIEI